MIIPEVCKRRVMCTALGLGFILNAMTATSTESPKEAAPENTKRRYSITERRIIKNTPPKPISLIETDGSVTIRGTDSGEIRLKAIKTGLSPSIDEARDIASELHIDVNAPSAGTTVTTRKPEFSNNRGGFIDYIAEVPSSAEVSVRTASGTVEVVGFSGQLSINTASGSVYIKSLAGGTAKVTSGGSVTVANCRGKLNASTASGTVSVTLAKKPEKGEITVESGSGDVTIIVPDGASATIEAEVPEGNIFAEGAITARKPDGSIEVIEVRNGGTKVRAKTSGKLYIKNEQNAEGR